MEMKVLHLISGGDTGGAKTHLISLMKGLDKRINAKVICFIEDTFYEDLKKEGIDIEVYEQKGRADMSVVRRLADEINNGSYDLIHCHGARANFVGMFLRRKINIPMVTTIHSDYKLDFKDSFYKRVVFTSLNTFALKRFKYFIAISDTFKELLVSRGFKADSIYIAYNGIDLDLKPKIVEKSEFLNRYDIEAKDDTLLGIVARLDQVKDHETFIKGARLVLDKRDDVQFLIAGTGNNEEALRDMVKELKLEDKIHFLGFVDDPYSMFNAIDINTLTSLSESFPYAILEGARMKKTIISTRVGGVNKLIENGVNGYIIDVGGYEELAEKIELLLNNKEKIKDMGEKLYEKVEKNFSSDSMAETHIEIYKDIINKWRK